MNKYLTVILLLITSTILTSCTGNFTQYIINDLKPTELIKIYNTKYPNLAIQSKCPSPLSIKIVNAEKNDQNYAFYKNAYGDNYITPTILVDSIITYMSDAFNRTGIKTDQNSTKVIEVSMESIKSWYNFNLTFSAMTQLKIVIPEKKYTQIYEYIDTTPRDPDVAVAYTIHETTWKVINDPIIQDYLLCTKMDAKNESPTEWTVLDILKKRYVKGEITKDQFEQMKKDIQ